MFVKESLTDVLKPKDSKEVSDKISSMSVEEKQSLLYNRGLDHFLGDFEGFFDWLEERYQEDHDRLWTTLIMTIEEFEERDDVDEKWIVNNMPADYLLREFYLDSMKEDNIDDALSFLIPGYISENIDILAPKTEEDIASNLHNVSGEQMLAMLDEEYDNWEFVLVDFYRYWGRDKFVTMFSEVLLNRIKERT